jgi:hypothetical protein
MTLDLSMLILSGLGVTVVGLAVALWTTSSALRRVRAELEATDSRVVALRREVEGATAIGVRAGERLRKTEQTYAQLADRLGQLELRGEGRPYDQAIAMVRHGADADRLVRNFGLTRGEADLVELVHGRRRAG